MAENNYNKRTQGNTGEDSAISHLLQNGYKILFRNYRYSRFGELDIIALDGDVLCFIEVKARTSLTYGSPRESVTKHKQLKIRKMAEVFLSSHTEYQSYVARFDFVGILHNRINNEYVVKHIELIKSAF